MDPARTRDRGIHTPFSLILPRGTQHAFVRGIMKCSHAHKEVTCLLSAITINLVASSNASADPMGAVQQQVLRGGLPSESQGSSLAASRPIPRVHTPAPPAYFSAAAPSRATTSRTEWAEQQKPAAPPSERTVPARIAGFQPDVGPRAEARGCIPRIYVEIYVVKLSIQVQEDKKDLEKLRTQLRKVVRTDAKQAASIRKRIETQTERLARDTVTYETARTELANNPDIQWFTPPRSAAAGGNA
jgi:hypothetical protein